MHLLHPLRPRPYVGHFSHVTVAVQGCGLQTQSASVHRIRRIAAFFSVADGCHAATQRSTILSYPLPLGPQQHQQLMYANMSVSEGGKEGGREGGTHMKFRRAREGH